MTLPAPIKRAFLANHYSRGKSDLSTTQIIDSPRVVLLREVYKESIAKNNRAEDNVLNTLGTAVHKIVEEQIEAMGGEDEDYIYIAEERLYSEIGGYIVSGGIDLQRVCKRSGRVSLIDWKVSTARAAIKPKREWELQLNAYKYLVEENKGVVVDNLEIGLFVRDWTRGMAEADPSYPQESFVMIPIPVWDSAKARDYVNQRAMMHAMSSLDMAMDKDVAWCSDEERWTTEPSYAVVRKGGIRPRRVVSDPDEAFQIANKFGPEYQVDMRPGAPLRCQGNYCKVAEWCSQWQQDPRRES